MTSDAPAAILDGDTVRVTGSVDADSVIPLRKQGERLINGPCAA